MSADESLPDFPFSSAARLEPKEEYGRRRVECPFGKVRLPSGEEAILLVRYADVAAATATPMLSRNHVMPGAARNSGESNFLYDPVLVMNQETDTHHLIHQVATQALTPYRVERYRAVIEQIARDLAADMSRSGTTTDLIEAFTDKLPLLTISRLLGVPSQDSPLIRRWAAAYTLSTPTPATERATMVEEFSAYVQDFAANPAEVPDSPLLQDLAFPPDGGPRLSHHDLTNLLKLMLSAGGTEAPSIVLGRSMFYLLLNDGRYWHELVRDREIALPMVMELLRLVYAGDTAALRTALVDVELPSGLVPAGHGVLLAWISALHDPDFYEDPETFRLERDGRNIGFGGGRNYCPGVNLAKAVLTIAIRTLAESFPGLRLAVPETSVPIAETVMGSIVRSLPVSW